MESGHDGDGEGDGETEKETEPESGISAHDWFLGTLGAFWGAFGGRECPHMSLIQPSPLKMTCCVSRT